MKNKKNIDFPSKLCDATAEITEDFSFAYLKEAFVATLLELARNDDGEDGEESSTEEGDDDDPFDKYEFWRVFKAQVKMLRSEMGNKTPEDADAGSKARATLGTYERLCPGRDELARMLDAVRLQGGPPPPRKAASLSARASQEADARNRFVQNGSVLSPIHSYNPLAHVKSSKLNDGVWEWGAA